MDLREFSIPEHVTQRNRFIRLDLDGEHFRHERFGGAESAEDNGCLEGFCGEDGRWDFGMGLVC